MTNTTTADGADTILESRRTPDVQALLKDYQQAGGVWQYTTRFNRSEASRFMVWDGQSEDGKKHRDALGKEPFPWEGAADGRIPFVDSIVSELKTADLVALARAQLKVVPTQAGQTEKAGAAQKLMDWLRRDCRAEVRAEGELFSDYRHGQGFAALQVMWDRQEAIKEETLTLDQLVQMAQQSPDMAGLPQMVLDPTQEDAVADLAAHWLDLTPKQARRLVRDLRTKGEGTYPKRYVARNRPCFTARRWGDDWFCAPETTDMQWARAHYIREFLGETELRERVHSEEWDAEVVEDWLKHAKGQSSVWQWAAQAWPVRQAGTVGFQTLSLVNELVEVVHAYVKTHTEDGIPEIRCTVFCPHRIKSESRDPLYAAYYPLGFDHALYPLVVASRERVSRRPADSRSVGELAFTWQNEVKAQRDMLTDRTNLEINPTVLVPSRGGQKFQIGPGNQVQRLLRDEIDYLKPPPGNPSLAFEVIKTVELQAANYFGLMHPEVPPAKWQAFLQRSVEEYLGAWEAALKMAFQLCQQYLSAEDLQRLGGGADGFPRTPEEIAGQFDFQLVFDARDLDMEFTFKKLDAVQKLAVPLDRAGVIDYGQLAGFALASIDASLAAGVVQSQPGAARAVYEQVGKDIAMMFLGNEPQYVENDPTAGMKLQFAQQVIAANPNYQQALTQEGRFKELVENYVKNLQQSITQLGQNVLTGRTGVKPVGG